MEKNILDMQHVSKEDTVNKQQLAEEKYEDQFDVLRAAAERFARAISELEPDPVFHPNIPQALIVGGFVRDMWLGTKSKDLDMEVYGVSSERLQEILEQMFGSVKLEGEVFKVFKVSLGNGLGMDVSIPRRDSQVGEKHQDVLVEGDPSMSILEAARRRDFTINTLAFDPLEGSIFDPFGGLKDMDQHILRVTDEERFQDDALRVLRAVQFVARFDLTVDPDSFELMKTMVARDKLSVLSKERVTEEFDKLLVKSMRPSKGLELIRMLGITTKHFPELHALIDVSQEQEWHPEGDVWIHTGMVVDEAAKIIRRETFTEKEQLTIMLGALCHDFGKPATTAFMDGRLRSLGHEEAGVEPTKLFFDRFTFSEKIEEGVLAIVKDHLKPGVLYRQFEKGKLNRQQYTNAVRKLLRRIAPLSWRVLVAASEADSRGRSLTGAQIDPYKSGEFMAEVIAEQGLDIAPILTLILGRDVLECERRLSTKPREPGKWVGDLIAAVEAERDAGHIQTREEGLAKLQQMMEV